MRIRHKKRGSVYEVLGEAEAQVSTKSEGVYMETPRRSLRDGDKLTVYRHIETGKLWCRFPDEMTDGRFEEIKEETNAPTLE
jgi:hypothetical protein